MNAAFLLEFVIALLEALVVKTKNEIDDVALAALKAAIRSLKEVQGYPVTKAQLEELRLKPKW